MLEVSFTCTYNGLYIQLSSLAPATGECALLPHKTAIMLSSTTSVQFSRAHRSPCKNQRLLAEYTRCEDVTTTMASIHLLPHCGTLLLSILHTFACLCPAWCRRRKDAVWRELCLLIEHQAVQLQVIVLQCQPLWCQVLIGYPPQNTQKDCGLGRHIEYFLQALKLSLPPREQNYSTSTVSAELSPLLVCTPPP